MPDRAVPNLPSRDFGGTVRFYGGFGFTPSYRDDAWLILRRGELVLEFFRFDDLVPEASSFMCSVRVDDVDELYEDIGLSAKKSGWRWACQALPAVPERSQRPSSALSPVS